VASHLRLHASAVPKLVALAVLQRHQVHVAARRVMQYVQMGPLHLYHTSVPVVMPQDAMLPGQSPASLRASAAPKLGALAALQRHLGAAPASHVVLFSSVASLLGNPGQANYVAANTGLDAWAAQLQAAGAPTSSLQWGAWADAGALPYAISFLAVSGKPTA
jgi:NAD(P)-dependent dehydrogenase (short-subunit alcohol dehydrogenase family)